MSRAFLRTVLVSFCALMFAILALISCFTKTHPASIGHPDRTAPAVLTD